MPEVKRSAQDGFTLIEVMVAMMILTVGLLSLAQMMVLATNSNSLSGRMTSASALAKEQMERLKATPFHIDPTTLTRNPALQDGGNIDVPGGGGYSQHYDAQGLPVAGSGQFEVRWEIETLPTTLPLEMVEIRVRCVAVSQDQFNVIGEALFTTFRTANVG
jgi:prepilin-type N-terminal cleavage/methylation domain-containing protein